MELVPTAALITAFLAGVAALFAPCCIGVLLPSYLATVFKTKTKIFLMTFVYYLGLLTVFLPLGLGLSFLGSFFTDNHVIIFGIGGLFMVVLGIFLLLGKSYMLPMHVKPELKKFDFGSLYVLGIFSGIATSCCAPVLAGVLALSFLPGSEFLGVIYALAFVTGIVTPLFISALLIDKTRVTEKLKSFKRKITYSLFGKKITLNLSHFIAGILYLIIGVFILVFETGSSDTGVSSYQLKLNLQVAKLTKSITSFTQSVPGFVWYILFIAIFIGIAWYAYRQMNTNDDNDKDITKKKEDK